VSAEEHLGPGKYSVHLKISAGRYDALEDVEEVIRRNAKSNRSKLLQAGSRYDIAHAKALNWGPLRAMQVRQRLEAKEVRRKQQQKQSKKSVDGSAEAESESDKEAEVWDAVCVVGLRVYARDANVELEIRQAGGKADTMLFDKGDRGV